MNFITTFWREFTGTPMRPSVLSWMPWIVSSSRTSILRRRAYWKVCSPAGVTPST